MKFPSVNYKGLVKLHVKIFFAGAILYWLISQNKLDFRLVGISFQNPVLWFTSFTILAAQIVLGAFRWRLILKTKKIEISLITLFLYLTTFASTFFVPLYLIYFFSASIILIEAFKNRFENFKNSLKLTGRL